MKAASWRTRKFRLKEILGCSNGDDEQEGLLLDRITLTRSDVDVNELNLVRFGTGDLIGLGNLETGQFGVVDVVKCRLNSRLYVRKVTDKSIACRYRDQCFPRLERDLLLRAYRTRTPYVPHLLASFQDTTTLSIVMQYAEGGTLWDVLESCSDERLCEKDLMWWTPQIIAAVSWCHAQGFAHRDIKPHNFVLTANSYLQLIDFGSVAPLLPSSPSGTRLIPKSFCTSLCGTCDYISPEILQAREEALVEMELQDDSQIALAPATEAGYGAETDIWSVGVMLYELAYGVAPFFANDIRQTYARILHHEKRLHFPAKVHLSSPLLDFLTRSITRAENRIGRRGYREVQSHCLFENVDWLRLHKREVPKELHLPHFTFAEQSRHGGNTSMSSDGRPDEHSVAFAFSQLFQSSQTAQDSQDREELDVIDTSLSSSESASLSIRTDIVNDQFIGYSWGPPANAFDQVKSPSPIVKTSDHVRIPSAVVAEDPSSIPFQTPLRPRATNYPTSTLPRASTVRKSAPRRPLDDREAMRQLSKCVVASARKRVLTLSTQKALLLQNQTRSSKSSLSASSSSRIAALDLVGSDGLPKPLKELRFVPAPLVLEGGASDDDDDDEGTVTTSSASEAPPSPSPSPRPGSAMSFSRRSATPTMTGTLSRLPSMGSLPSIEEIKDRPLSPAATPRPVQRTRSNSSAITTATAIDNCNYSPPEPSDLPYPTSLAQTAPEHSRIPPRASIRYSPLDSPNLPFTTSHAQHSRIPSRASTVESPRLDDLEDRYEHLIANVVRLESRLATFIEEYGNGG